MTETPLYK